MKSLLASAIMFRKHRANNISQGDFIIRNRTRISHNCTRLLSKFLLRYIPNLRKYIIIPRLTLVSNDAGPCERMQSRQRCWRLIYPRCRWHGRAYYKTTTDNASDLLLSVLGRGHQCIPVSTKTASIPPINDGARDLRKCTSGLLELRCTERHIGSREHRPSR